MFNRDTHTYIPLLPLRHQQESDPISLTGTESDLELQVTGRPMSDCDQAGDVAGSSPAGFNFWQALHWWHGGSAAEPCKIYHQQILNANCGLVMD